MYFKNITLILSILTALGIAQSLNGMQVAQRLVAKRAQFLANEPTLAKIFYGVSGAFCVGVTAQIASESYYGPFYCCNYCGVHAKDFPTLEERNSALQKVQLITEGSSYTAAFAFGGAPGGITVVTATQLVKYLEKKYPAKPMGLTANNKDQCSGQ